MPIFEYACPTCTKEFEEIVSYSKRLDVKCAGCGNTPELKMSLIAGHRYYGGANTGFHRSNIKADL